MKTIYSIIFLCAALMAFSQEKPKKFWIYFVSKENLTFSKAASYAELSSLTGISERSFLRRSKISSEPLSSEDMPVSSSHIGALKENGIVIENISRWFNAATAYLTDDQRNAIQSLPFIRSIEPVVVLTRREAPKTESKIQTFAKQTANKYLYGPSEIQMTLMNAIAVHNIGISGRGVLVGMLDTGFRWKIHEAMKNMKVIAEYDFIQKDSSTANGAGDSGSQDSHGTSTMSLVGGYKEGTLVSPAFNAQFILGKTEYVPSETNIEEDNWVAAIEWMESKGVDVVSSSLGYSTFDAGQKSYVYADMNGKTATTSKAAVIAARKGVAVFNAMGNEAQTAWHYLTSPADADSIVSVGAVSSNGTVASFSSVGPTSDGRIKPDVSAQGVSVYATVPSGTYSSSFGGTSAATPLAAGVAAMILSARPELTPIQVREALRLTASNAAKPDNSTGWGIVNAYKAVLYHGMVISTDPEIALMQDSNISIGLFVVSPTAVKRDSIQLFYTTDNGTTFSPLKMTLKDIVDTATNSGRYTAVIPKSSATPRFYIRAVDAAGKQRTSPFNAPAALYDAKTGTTSIPLQNTVPSSYSLKQNYPNPFNPSTVITYEIPRSGFVTLTVYDMLGREVQTLVSDFQVPNTYSVLMNGSGLSSGTYCYRLKTENFSETKRMMLVK